MTVHIVSMKISALKRDETREKIITLGTQLLQKNGYNGIGIGEIASLVGIPKGSFYNYFGSKEDFCAEALSNYAENAFQHVEIFLKDQSLTPVERILKMYQSRVDNEKANLKQGIACLGNMIGQEMGSHGNLTNRLEELFSGMVIRLEECLNEAVDLKQIQLSQSSKKTAEFLEFSWRGAMLAARARQSEEQLDQFLSFLPGLLQIIMPRK
ncbi:TetR/AcrR family transcriptional regulator [Leptospira sp. SA-E8]|uniref:TetR/AcrR family transcriptional regulator n=1 Tax=Leptospira sp. SA-E8 TaxID=3422259 RepID=UPI003EBE872A